MRLAGETLNHEPPSTTRSRASSTTRSRASVDHAVTSLRRPRGHEPPSTTRSQPPPPPRVIRRLSQIPPEGGVGDDTDVPGVGLVGSGGVGHVRAPVRALVV